MSVNSGALSVRVVWRVCEDPGESHLRGGLSQAASVKQIVELASSGLVVDRSIRLFPGKVCAFTFVHSLAAWIPFVAVSLND